MKMGGDLLLPQMERLYRGKPLREITVGNSGYGVLEVERGARRFILQVSVYSEKKRAHLNFEIR